jgi:hypothetical protein
VLWFYLLFLVALKIPLFYLCYVLWWAIKDPPRPDEAEDYDGVREPGLDPESEASWWHRQLRRGGPRRGPHGTPSRRPQTAFARVRGAR